MSKCRGWAYTFHNYTDADIDAFRKLKCTYHVIGREVCPQTGTPHLQGYIHFTVQRTRSAIRKSLGQLGITREFYLTEAKNSAEVNRIYCSKDGSFEEIGDCPAPGKRTDLDNVRDTLRSHAPRPMATIVDTARSFQSVRMAQAWLTHNESERDWKTEVFWLYGSTGTGKSLSVMKACAAQSLKPYIAKDSSKWWDGYDAHECVIIDDMRGDFIKFHGLLRLLDRLPYSVEVKGGYRQFLARMLFITSPYHPCELYDKSPEDNRQLLRRIEHVIHFSEKTLQNIVHTSITLEWLRCQDEDHVLEPVALSVKEVDEGDEWL